MARPVSLVVMVAVVVVMMAGIAQARYLPTRGDDSRLEEIRELLREILERAAEGGSNTGSRDAAAVAAYDKHFLYKRSLAPEGTMGKGGAPLTRLHQQQQ